MRLMMIAVLVFSVIGCVHSPNGTDNDKTIDGNLIHHNEQTTPKEIKFNSKRATPDEIAECEQQGGVVRKAGMLQFDMCIITYPDAGKICTKGDDCQSGVCQPRFDKTENKNAPINKAPITGVCKADNNPFGCRSFIENGQIRHICVD